MRFTKWFAVLAVTIVMLASGCQMSDSSMPTEAEGERGVALSANYVEIQQMIIALFPKGPSRFAKKEFLQIARQFYNGQTAAAQARTENLIDHIFAQYEAGILKDASPSTEEAVAELVLTLAQYVDIAPAPETVVDGGTILCTPGDDCEETTVQDHGGVSIPGEFITQPFVIYLVRLPDDFADPPLFPLFYEIHTIPEGITFDSPPPSGSLSLSQVGELPVAGVCALDEDDPLGVPEDAVPGTNLFLAHQVDGEWEQLPYEDIGFLQCEDASSGELESASVWMGRLNLALSPVLEILSPNVLHARGRGLGGAITSFSPFGALHTGGDLTVTITSPIDGTETSDATVNLEGSVSDPTATATATMSGATDFEIPLTLNAGGGFSQQIPLQVGASTITVRAVDDNENVGEDSVEVTRTGTTEELTITLTWNTATDMDLHLLRGAETPFYDSLDDCFFANCRSTNGLEWGPAGSVGNPFLDVDDRDGIGPENIRLDQVETDLIYRVGVDAFDGGPTLNTVRVTFQGATIECSRVLQSGTVDDLLVVAIIDPQPGGDGAVCTDLEPSTASALRPARVTKPITKPR